MRSLFVLLALPLALAAALSPHQKLVDLAKAGNGIVNLDANSFDLVTAPNRNWSVAIHLTALDPKRRCAPCRYVHPTAISSAILNTLRNREFDSSWKSVAAAWTRVPKEHYDNHFFATLDFDNGYTVFQKVLESLPTSDAWSETIPSLGYPMHLSFLYIPRQKALAPLPAEMHLLPNTIFLSKS